MVKILIRFPLPHEPANDYEAIGRFVSMGIHVERMLQYCLYSAKLASAEELRKMRLVDKISALSRLISDDRFDLKEFERLPAKLREWKQVRNAYVHGMTAELPTDRNDALDGAPVLRSTRLSRADRVEAESLVVVLFECCRRIATYIGVRHLNPGMVIHWPDENYVNDIVADLAEHNDTVAGEFF
jgi:hypothetical protein